MDSTAKDVFGPRFVLRDEQRQAVDALLRGKDCWVQLPTGFGKSAIFTLFPILKSKLEKQPKTALVISPLKALMADQRSRLQELGLCVTSITKDDTEANLAELLTTHLDVILASPEAVTSKAFQLTITKKELHEKICVICFDEGHCISQWGLNFRPAYRKACNVVALFHDIPTLILTATATIKDFNDISGILALSPDFEVVSKLPDRPNIYLHVQKVKERFEDHLGWVAQEVREKGREAKKMLIYTTSLNSCQKIFNWLAEETLGKKCEHPCQHSLVEMFHSHTTSTKSEHIMSNFSRSNSCIRVIVTTLALALGVDVPDVDVVVNWGAVNTLSYWQEVGRCARHLDEGCAILYAYPRSLHTCDSTMKELVKEQKCIRTTILEVFKIPGTPDLDSTSDHCNCTAEKPPCRCRFCMCCSNCFEACQCQYKYDSVQARFLKGKLELITGCSAAATDLELYTSEGKLVGPMNNDDALLGSYPIEDDMRIHVINRDSNRAAGEFEDVSRVEKFEISQDEYDKRSDSVRAFKKKMKMGQFKEISPEEQARIDEEKAQKAAEEERLANAITVGSRCEVAVPNAPPTKRGTVRYVGKADFKPGYWVGVQYDEPLGKNDGSVGDKRYFECPAKYGGFVKPQYVTVGDFPEEDLDLDEM